MMMMVPTMMMMMMETTMMLLMMMTMMRAGSGREEYCLQSKGSKAQNCTELAAPNIQKGFLNFADSYLRRKKYIFDSRIMHKDNFLGSKREF